MYGIGFSHFKEILNNLLLDTCAMHTFIQMCFVHRQGFYSFSVTNSINFSRIFSKVAYGIVSFREMPDNTTHGPQIIGAYQTYTITVHRGVQNVKL